MSGTQWIYLQGIDCFEPPAIGILVLVDNGRQTEQGTLSLRVGAAKRGRESTWRGWGPLMERRKTEKRQGKEKDGNKLSHAVIFTCDFWQQSSKDKMFHCKSGYILLCTLNIQVFGVKVVPLQEEKMKKAVACLSLTELSWRILVEFQNPDWWNTESYRKLWSPSDVFISCCRKLTCKHSKWTVTLIMEVLTLVVKSFKCSSFLNVSFDGCFLFAVLFWTSKWNYWLLDYWKMTVIVFGPQFHWAVSVSINLSAQMDKVLGSSLKGFIKYSAWLAESYTLLFSFFFTTKLSNYPVSVKVEVDVKELFVSVSRLIWNSFVSHFPCPVKCPIVVCDYFSSVLGLTCD